MNSNVLNTRQRNQRLLHTTVKAYVIGSIKKIVEAVIQERDNQINSIAKDLSKSMKAE